MVTSRARQLRVISGFAACAAVALLGSLSVSAERPAPSAALATAGEGFTVELPVAVAQRVSALRQQPAVNAAPGHLAADPVRLELQDFENAAFPPANWQLLDNLSPTNPQYLFSRQACDVEPLRGGTANAWVVGGGSRGQLLPCGSPYTSTLETWLIFGPVNLTGYPGGLQANMLLKLNQGNPAGGQFQVCASNGASATSVQCRGITPGTVNWTTFQTPVTLPWAANLTNAVFALRYADDLVPGNVFGAYVDNILIEAVPDQGATPTATRAATQPTIATATATTPGGRREVYLPISFKETGVSELPTPFSPPSSGVSVQFGVDVNENLELIQPGSVFQYGVPSICALVTWFGQPPGTSLRWQWYKDGNLLNVTDLNGTEPNIAASGRLASCAIGGEDAQGNPLPVPRGRYEVLAYLNTSQTASGQSQVIIQNDPPAGATAIPTGPLPTRTPTLTPMPTETPDPGSNGCKQVIRNGGFEAGAVAPWYAFLNTQRLGLEQIIMKASTLPLDPKPPATDGEWVAFFGAQTSIEEQLGQRWLPGDVPVTPSELVSATLKFNLMIVTQETANGTDDDWIAPFFGRNDGTAEQAPVGISEETVGPDFRVGVWYTFTTNVTTVLKNANPFDRLVFISRHNAAGLTGYVLDEVAMTVCQTPALHVAPHGAGRSLPAGAEAPSLRHAPVRITGAQAARSLGPAVANIRVRR